MADDKLKTLKLTRKSIKSSLTRFKTYFESQINQAQPDIDTLESRLAHALTLLEDFENNQLEIDSLNCNDQNSTIDNDTRNAFETTYFEVTSKAKRFLADQKVQNNASNSSIFFSNNSDTIQNHSNTFSHIKLPDIKLPTFEGSYKTWVFFRETFMSVIDNHPSMPKSQKLNYLRLSLKGEPFNLIESLEICDASYDIAWSCLTDKYENTEKLINNQVKELFNLPVIQKENHASLSRLFDSTNRILKALRALHEPVDYWDTLLVHLLTTKLSNSGRDAWEAKKPKREKPNLKIFLNFLNDRCDVFESMEDNKPIQNQQTASNSNYSNSKKNNFVKTLTTLTTDNSNDSSNTNHYTPKCVICEKNHTVYNCNSFLQLDVNERYNETKRLKLCLNCLRKNHTIKDCNASKCRKCGRAHNTLLHFNDNSVNATSPISNSSANASSSRTVGADADNVSPKPDSSGVAGLQSKSYCSLFSETCMLLSTAVVNILDYSGKTHNCRVLLDSGSQCNLITTSLCDKLSLQQIKIQASITGINESNSKIRSRTRATLQSRLNPFSVHLDCLVLDTITGSVPCKTFDKNNLNIPTNFNLADPGFDVTAPIDLLIGVETFWELLCVGQHKLGLNGPYLQKTHFGWVVSGPLALRDSINSNTLCNLNTLNNTDLSEQLEKFWRLEGVAEKTHLSPEEIFCEQHFQTNTFRDNAGRFIVSYPFKHDLSKLGDSMNTARNRFYSLERKMNKNETLRDQYSSFISEYIELGHMTKLPNDEDSSGFYLPHHPVFKATSTTTKIRVVFDGSAKSTSGLSINDLMMVGPTIQNDLFSIVIRFRKHPIVISADVAKMYRQILIKDDQRQFQKVIWRFNPTDTLSAYQLNTVTYGLASSAFLATRCLHQIGDDIKDSNPTLSSIIQNDFYVDDLLSGGDSLENVLEIKNDLVKLFESYGLHLRKWNSNCHGIFSESDFSNCIEIGDSENNRALGLNWNPIVDTLTYSMPQLPINNKITKRSILSSISQLFDPLGLLSPVIIVAKIIIQELWQLRASWDESVPLSMQTKWFNFQNDLKQISELKIPRHVLCEKPSFIELCGFADASQAAYGCCIYLISLDSSGNYFSSLLCAKSRVAPLKVVTIPRLELCAALLLAELMAKVKSSLNLKLNKISYYSDSTITLSWIHTSPHTLKIFVANRISQIQSLTNAADWHHVSTDDNPADLLTRGIPITNLISSQLWWQGPKFLLSPIEHRDKVFTPSPLDDLPETKPKALACTFVCTTKFLELPRLNDCSSFKRLQRIFSYVLRFIQNCRPNSHKSYGPLTPNEMECSLYHLTLMVQREAFPLEIQSLKKKGIIDSKGSLSGLNPFIDDLGILRVGGRLRNSEFDYSKKHPAVLPKSHVFSKLYARFKHFHLLHAGPTLLLATIRETFWPIDGRNLTKSVVHNCIQCFRFNAKTVKYLMADMPTDRLQSSRPFSVCGTDYAGPFYLKDRKTRNYKLFKAYICLFVCLSTKSLHLELVSDLTTDCFLASLRRFMARRGLCRKIFSDHGTNFQGAHNELKRFFKQNSNEIQDRLSNDGIMWTFIPPNSPHFGGLWEAGVKSVKHHLRRTIGDTRLTFEEFSTLLVQIEACLNSRPLCPLSDDPNDPAPLTPAHFLIGSPLMSIPDADLTDFAENRLNRYELIQKRLQQFWKRWSVEYVSQLQPRKKWKTPSSSILKPGELVLIKEDGLPPLKWSVGRVQEVLAGTDGVVRSAKIKTSTSTLHRPVAKLSVLPCS